MQDDLEVCDPDGRAVVLDERTRGHLARRHPELLESEDAIMAAVERPDHRAEDVIPDREEFYRHDLDPRRWLCVVVDFNVSPAFVVTAFVQDTKPRGWKS